MSHRIITGSREQIKEQQAQIDRFERIFNNLRHFRDQLLEYSKELIIFGPSVATIANGITEILEDEE
jgi:hypothetical protein